MKPYHGTPGSGTRVDVARFLKNRHALVPFPRQDDLGIVAEVCQSFVLDNGAYTIWNKGGTLDVAGYVEWVRIWHLHESIDRLVTLANTWRTVALGSSGEFSRPGSLAWWGRMREALNAICDDQGRPVCRLHGLRMLDPRLFSRLPLASADSTNAVRNQSQLERFGMYAPPTAAQRMAVIADRVEDRNSAAIFERTGEEWGAWYSRFVEQHQRGAA